MFSRKVKKTIDKLFHAQLLFNQMKDVKVASLNPHFILRKKELNIRNIAQSHTQSKFAIFLTRCNARTTMVASKRSGIID